MKITLAKTLYEEGVLTGARITPAPSDDDVERFFLVFDRLSGVEETVTTVRDNEVKVYRKYSGAIIDAREVGFKEINMKFEK